MMACWCIISGIHPGKLIVRISIYIMLFSHILYNCCAKYCLSKFGLLGFAVLLSLSTLLFKALLEEGYYCINGGTLLLLRGTHQEFQVSLSSARDTIKNQERPVGVVEFLS